MNIYSEERKQLQEQGLIPSWLYNYCHDRFEFSIEHKGLIIKKTKQAKGKIGDRPGNLRPDQRRLINVSPRRYFEHQLVWLMFTGKFPRNQIDHINGDPTDNRIDNLREATNAQNCANRGLQKNSSTGYKGVTERKDLKTNKFCAHIKHLGKQFNLGYFITKEDAAKAYDEAAKRLFGEFARLNFEV